jgi:hypothetical protein
MGICKDGRIVGHRSWFTFVESKSEWIDLWRVLSRATERWDALVALGISELARRQIIPAYFSMDYVLEVKNEGGPFTAGSVVLAWSSGGDYSIEALPYYLRQQTEYIETVLAKFPDFHHPPDGPARFGKMFHPVPTVLDVLKGGDWGDESGSEAKELLAVALPFLETLPDQIEVDWGTKSEAAFVKQMYRRLYKDPSALGDINQSVFISYSSKDRRFARRLAEDIKPHGLKVWIDDGELKIGDSLIWKISEAVRTSDFLIVILSESSVNSSWVQKELEIAMMQEITQSRYKILPVLKDKCAVPAFLSGKLFADFSRKGHRQRNLQRLIGSMLPSHAVRMMLEAAAPPGMTVHVNPGEDGANW